MKRVIFIALISSLVLSMPACGQIAAEEPETSFKAEMTASIQETEPAPVKENAGSTSNTEEEPTVKA